MTYIPCFLLIITIEAHPYLRFPAIKLFPHSAPTFLVHYATNVGQNICARDEQGSVLSKSLVAGLFLFLII